jgi:hypothetical protein
MSETAKISQAPGEYLLKSFRPRNDFNSYPGVFKKAKAVENTKVDSELRGITSKLIKETPVVPRQLVEKEKEVVIVNDYMNSNSADTRKHKSCNFLNQQTVVYSSGLRKSTPTVRFSIDTRF